MANKRLIIPLVTPLREKSSGKEALSIERYDSTDYFVDSQGLVRLVNSMKDVFDLDPKGMNRVLVGGSAGNGSNLSLELWQQIIGFSMSLIPSNNLMIGVLLEDGLGALEFLRKLNSEFQNLVFGFRGLPEESFLKKSGTPFLIRDIHFESNIYLFYSNAHNNNVENSVIVDSVKNLKSMRYNVIGIIDGRKDDELILSSMGTKLTELRRLLPEEVSLYETWEDRFFVTNTHVVGGAFPIANIEPELIQRMVNNTNDFVNNGVKQKVIQTIVRKVASGNGWQVKLKDAMQRPSESELRYDYRDFSIAWDVFFKSYAEEPMSNQHVVNFDVRNPLTSILRSVISDMLSFQALYFRDNPSKTFLFFPHELKITSRIPNSAKINEAIGEWWVLKDGVNESSVASNSFNRMIKSFWTSPFEIESMILDENMLFKSDKGLFEQLLLETGASFPKVSPKSVNSPFSVIKVDPVNYSASDGSGDYSLEMTILVNTSLVAEIPNFVLKNLFRIGVFTKRNRLQIDEALRHARSAAVASIFARNYSHHVGSHVKGRSTIPEVRKRITELYGWNV